MIPGEHRLDPATISLGVDQTDDHQQPTHSQIRKKRVSPTSVWFQPYFCILKTLYGFTLDTVQDDATSSWMLICHVDF
uniref:Uncharacterized protein n=1 Tax=Gorilla gorilla gorilla TaxID=9595 RepID=G3RNT1_GORGO